MKKILVVLMVFLAFAALNFCTKDESLQQMQVRNEMNSATPNLKSYFRDCIHCKYCGRDKCCTDCPGRGCFASPIYCPYCNAQIGDAALYAVRCID